MKSMNHEGIISHLLSWLEEAGCFVKIVSINHLNEIEAELYMRHDQGSFSEEFYQERLTTFRYQPYSNIKEPKSIIIIAVPQPTILLIFRYLGLDHSMYIPPTYDYSIDAELKHHLKKIIQPYSYHLASTYIPLKLFAVRSGLAEYGRNNICYIPGEGSFFRLVAFYTDLPCLKDNWRYTVMMERCKVCRTCVVACPLGAINEDRFLLHAERCLAFHNEHSGNFPQNIDSNLHHCLFGCMICQNVCPENKKNVGWIEEREQFSEYETFAILNGIPLEQIPNSTKKKLSKLGLIDDYLILARNLSVLLN